MARRAAPDYLINGSSRSALSAGGQTSPCGSAHSRQSPIGADCGEFGKFVAICEAEGERPRGAGDSAARRGWLPRVHAPLGEGRGRDHAELRRARPGFRESEIGGMNGERGRLSRRLGGRPKCRAASDGRGRRHNRSPQPPGRSPSGTLGRTTRSPTANHRRQCPAAARSAARWRRSRRVSRAAIAARSSR